MFTLSLPRNEDTSSNCSSDSHLKPIIRSGHSKAAVNFELVVNINRTSASNKIDCHWSVPPFAAEGMLDE